MNLYVKDYWIYRLSVTSNGLSISYGPASCTFLNVVHWESAAIVVITSAISSLAVTPARPVARAK